MVHEAESDDLRDFLCSTDLIATNHVARAEVERAAKLADPSEATASEVSRVLGTCHRVDLTDELLSVASALTSKTLTTLDAIHLASALHVEPNAFVVYDRKLAAHAISQGLSVEAPGAGS